MKLTNTKEKLLWIHVFLILREPHYIWSGETGVCALPHLPCACDHGQALSLLELWVLSHRIFIWIKEANGYKKHIVICKMVYTCQLLLSIKFVEVNLKLICKIISSMVMKQNSLTVKTTDLYLKLIECIGILSSRNKKGRFYFNTSVIEVIKRYSIRRIQ